MTFSAPAGPRVVRARFRVRGQVQGVGFRPFVYRLATGLGLAGWVRNDGEGVILEVQGPAPALERFATRLTAEAPTLARIDALERESLAVQAGEDFRILESAGGPARTQVVPDTAVCGDCVAELFDPADRRYRYPFINCTHCGPRYTITRALPYDRPNTSMAGFPLCTTCREEFEAPGDRRFHAQPNACPECGPALEWREADGSAAPVEDVIGEAVRRLRAGDILAIKGLGGFHLACDARHPEAVARLRQRKHREEKPFAVMAANLATLEQFAFCPEPSRHLLSAPERPIVLLRKRPACDRGLAGCAPGIAWLGAMLPYTPLHYLLFHEAAGRPEGTGWLEAPQETVLVMTSANPGGEPLVIDNEEAVRRLHGIADAFVLHDRPIEVRCDDSLVRAQRSGPAFIRRARGYTPRPVRLPAAGPATLAVGGWFKNTVCLTRGDEAFVSQHIGDLDHPATCAFLEEAVVHLAEVLQVCPEQVAHDRHPDFHSTRFAADYAFGAGLPTVAVQHHHAHVAAVAAENRLEGPLLGLALDGVGLGEDGAAWGGELLRVDGAGFERLGHLRPLRLPGGDRAAREPWRMGASVLFELGGADEVSRRYRGPAAEAVAEMLAREVNSPATSSMGRWFDAAAAVLEVRRMSAFEGQAAMLLEGLAERHGPVAPLEEGFTLNMAGQLDLMPLLAELAEIHDAPYGAALFHATLMEALTAWVGWHAERSGIDRVALAGGCFLNHILTTELPQRLAAQGIRAYGAFQLPPNDGGLSLGQAWVAIQAATDS
jgi:hydrogenase maturation protein HypF